MTRPLKSLKGYNSWSQSFDYPSKRHGSYSGAVGTRHSRRSECGDDTRYNPDRTKSGTVVEARKSNTPDSGLRTRVMV